MKFLQITIENFLAIGEAKVKLADRGLVLVQGVNEDDSSADSNGAGKSSLADALCWALFGETARDIAGDDVVNHAAGKGTRVQVDIEDGEEVYRIARHRKHKTGKNAAQVLRLAKDGTITDLTLGTDKLTQEVINRIVGCSLEVFYASIYAGQEQMPDLPGMTDKQLKVLVEEAAGVTILEEAYREASRRLTATKATYEEIKRQGEALAARVDDARARVEEMAKGIAEFENHRVVVIGDLINRAKAARSEADMHDAELAALDKPSIEARLADCEAKIAAVSGEQVELRTLDWAVNAAAAKLTIAQNHVQASAQTARTVRDELEAVGHRVGCPCPECARPLTAEDIEPTRVALKARLDAMLDDVRNAKNDEGDARKTLQSVTDKRDAFAASMTDLHAENAQRASLTAELKRAQNLDTMSAGARNEVRRLAAEAKAKRDEANPFRSRHEAAVSALAAREAEVAAGVAKITDTLAAVSIAEFVAKVFSPSAVRAHILDDVTPFLNEQTAKYLSTLSDGNITATWTTLVKTAKGELREKFSIEVAKEKAAQSFKGLSGGEKRKVRIAAALALQDLVARRATKPIDLFVGDEIDNALDGAGLERLCVVLQEKARERGTVLVVSHADLKDWISQVALFRMKDGRSVVEETVS